MLPLHSLLQNSGQEPRSVLPVKAQALTLPTPVFPQFPELLHELDEADIAIHEAVRRTGKRHWPASRVLKSMRG